MRIAIAFTPPLRRWQQRLADCLVRHGHEVAFHAGARRRLGFGVIQALAVQQRVFGPRPSLFDAVSADEPAMFRDAASADLLIALDGEQAEAPFIIEPTFDGGTGAAAMIAMLASRGSARCVRVRLVQNAEAADLVVAHLAIQDPEILSRALHQTAARLVTLILQAVRRLGVSIDTEGFPSPLWGGARGRGSRSLFDRDQTAINSQRDEPPSLSLPHKGEGDAVASSELTLRHGSRLIRLSRRSPVMHVAGAFLQKAAARLRRANSGPSHWRVAFRLGNTDVRRDGRWPAERFTILPDDGLRFYADPVPFLREGRRYIFLEDYPYATSKAVIAVTEIGADGAASPPRTVLEQPCHLSYPFIIRHGGEIYMLPEMSGAGRVQLFRADPFPDRWVPDRVLLSGVVAADATLVEHAGRWWMFATLADDGGSSWDQLCLFHAPDLFGPWTPHADNPVLVDAGAARPAGAMWEENGVLMRAAQDCRAGYGRGLAICRVDRLDETGYAQTVVARLGPPDGSGADGVHTLDRVDALEVIDLRFPPAGR